MQNEIPCAACGGRGPHTGIGHEYVRGVSHVYPFVLLFTREFTSGVFAGMHIQEAMGFTSRIEATNWVREINAAHEQKKLTYRVINTRCEANAQQT